eukprot:3275438-Pleurochrysis_carterae.AAC.5
MQHQAQRGVVVRRVRRGIERLLKRRGVLFEVLLVPHKDAVVPRPPAQVKVDHAEPDRILDKSKSEGARLCIGATEEEEVPHAAAADRVARGVAPVAHDEHVVAGWHCLKKRRERAQDDVGRIGK